MAKVAVVRIRGTAKVAAGTESTLEMLKLYRRNYCIVVENTQSNMGMIVKCKDFVTWGELDDETYKVLVEKKGEKDGEGKLKKFFRMNPPIGGFERKGTKKAFTVGGALGFRGDKINILLKKMM
jgi:large subunit ribosomal protein L30